MRAILLSAFLLFPVGTALAQDARIAAARRSFELARARVVRDGDVEEVYAWSLRLMTAEREAAPARAVPAYTAHLQRMTTLQAAVQARVAQGVAPPLAASSCDYYVAEARVWVAGPRDPDGSSELARRP